MILASKQYKRFVKLLSSLCLYTRREMERNLNELSVDISGDSIDLGTIFSAVDNIWGDLGDLSRIDRYVQKNPDGYSRTDLREIESWKRGLFADFTVVRDGNDTVFSYQGFGFAVRGAGREIFELAAPLPAHVTTVLLPFDNLITFGLSITESEGPFEDATLPSVTDMKEQRRFARTARDFTRIADQARIIWEQGKADRVKKIAHTVLEETDYDCVLPSETAMPFEDRA